MRRVFLTALAATAVATATPVFAQSATVNGSTVATLTVGGPGTTISFGGPAGTTASADLFLQLTGASTTTGDYTFSYTFTNTNPSISNLVNFGFDTSPTLGGITGTGMNFYLNPNGTLNVNACAGPLAASNCDAANGQGDLFSGSFTLDFANNTSSITLNDFVDRYASLSQIGGISGEGTPVRGVPEPATWALMLLGFGGIGMAMRRSNKRKPALMQIA
jgi:PEP-CTERM motif